MRKVSTLALAAVISTSMIAGGCSTKSSPVAMLPAAAGRAVDTQSVGAPIDKTGVPPRLFVNEASVGVLVYKQVGTNQSPIKTLTSGLSRPEGEFVNSNGDLYVTNFGNQKVSIFKRGRSTPYKTLIDSSWYPGSAAVDTTGTVYVCNYEGTVAGSPGPPGDVAVYAGGSTTPTSTLPAPVSGDWVLWCAVDNNHNLFVGYTDNVATSNVAEYVGGSGTPVLLNLQIGFPGQMEFDSRGNLVVADERNYQVDAYKLPGKKPIHTITMPVSGAPIVGMTFNSKATHLYASDYNSGQVYEFAYPKGTLLDTITPTGGSGNLQGLAADPPAPL